MASKVQICNLALARLGSSRITALTDATEAAKLCNLLYDDMVEETIIEGSWSTTIKRAALAQTTNTPVYDFTYEFQLPVDPKCLKVLTINEETHGDNEYRVEGDKLLANISTMSIRYIGLLTDPEDFGPVLKRAVVARLAAELAYPLTGSAGVASDMFELYNSILAQGLAIDGQQGSAEKVLSRGLHEVR